LPDLPFQIRFELALQALSLLCPYQTTLVKKGSTTSATHMKKERSSKKLSFQKGQVRWKVPPDPKAQVV